MIDKNNYFLSSEGVNDETATIIKLFFSSGDKVKIGDLIKHKKFPPPKSYGLYSESKYFVDIDEKKDLDIANLLIKKK